MDNFGTYLKEHREKRGIRLEEIASITKIHLRSLEFLEASRWEDLPPEPFIRGFILAYAKYVGLDTKEAIERYVEEMVKAENLTSPTFISPVVDKRPNIRTLDESEKKAPARPAPQASPDKVMEAVQTLPLQKIGIGVSAVAVLGIVLWIGSIGKSTLTKPVPIVAQTTPTEPSKANVSGESVADLFARAGVKTDERKLASPEVAKTEPAKPVEVTKPVVAKAETKVEPKVEPKAKAEAKAEPKVEAPKVAVVAPPAAKPKVETPTAADTSGEGHELVVEGKERTWVKVVLDDEAPMEFFLPEGEKATYRAKSKIKVVLGNSTGSKVLHNGEETSGKKFQGTIRSYIFPATAHFPQDPPLKRVEASDGAASDAQ